MRFLRQEMYNMTCKIRILLAFQMPGQLLMAVETVRYLAQKLWQTLPHRIRESQSLTAFKKELRTHTIECDCRLCKIFIPSLGFI